MVARDDHRHLAARGLLEDGEQRRAAEPLHGELAEGDLVARHLVEDRRLAAAVRQQVDEVEDEGAHAFVSDRAAEVALEVVGVGGRRDLGVAHRHRVAELLELQLEELALVRVEGLVLALAPHVGEACRDLARKEAAEEGVARVRRGRREDGEVVRRLDLEVGREQRLDGEPLVEAQAVDDDEDRLRVAAEDGEDELLDDVDRERGPFTVEVAQPGRVGLEHEAGELAVHVGVEAAQRLVEARLAGRGEVHVPAHQLREALHPAAPVEGALPLQLDGAKALDEGAGDRLLADARPVEDAGDGGQHLTRVDRLDQVVADVGAERLLEGGVLLALRDDDDGEVGGQLLEVLERVETAAAGHLLVEQHDVEGAPSQHLQRVVGVARAVHLVALLPQEDAVRLEKLDLVVDPEDGLGVGGHAGS